jgi:pyridoxamine 5'-phosphate oxidase
MTSRIRASVGDRSPDRVQWAAMRIDGEPWQLLADWLPPNEDHDRPAMTLATVTAGGTPDARTVLLTEFDREGFYFHTDARSRKVAQLAGNASVALTLVWQFTRQLVVLGTAEPAPAGEVAAAFRRQSAYLQQLAWQNTLEFARLPEAERRSRWREFGEQHADGFDQPPTWIGYLVRPHRLTFWHGDPDTASRRTEFTATGGGWERTLLPG